MLTFRRTRFGWFSYTLRGATFSEPLCESSFQAVQPCERSMISARIEFRPSSHSLAMDAAQQRLAAIEELLRNQQVLYSETIAFM